MDAEGNPFEPRLNREAITGRERELEVIGTVLRRLVAGEPASPVVFSGRSGTGVSSILDVVPGQAAAVDWHAGFARPSSVEPLREAVALAFARALTSFAARRPGALAVRTAGDAVAAFDPTVMDELPGTVDPLARDERRGDLARDLRRLLARVGDGLRDLVGRGFVIVLDDLHHAEAADAIALLRTFAEAMRDGLPLGLFVGGTPTVRWFAGQAGLGDEVVDVLPLPRRAVEALVASRVEAFGCSFDEAAIAALTKLTGGYPALVMAYGRGAWQAATDRVGGRPSFLIDDDVITGASVARGLLARGTLAPAFAVGAAERRYLRAVAEESDPVDSAVVARRLGDTTRFGSGASHLTQVRDALVRRGLLSNLDGTNVSFAHPAARSYVLTWE